MGFVRGSGDFDEGRGRMKFNTHWTLILKILCMAKTELDPTGGMCLEGTAAFVSKGCKLSPMSQHNRDIPPCCLEILSPDFFFWILLLLSPAQPGDSLSTWPLVLWNIFAFPVPSSLQWLPHAYLHPCFHLPGAVCLSGAPFLPVWGVSKVS